MQDAPKHCVAFIDNADRGEAVRAILAGAGFDQAAVDVLSVDEMAHARSLKADVILVAVEAPHASLMASLRAKSPHCVLLVAVADPGVEVEAALEGAGADHIFDATHLSSGELRRALALASRLRATTEELDESAQPVLKIGWLRPAIGSGSLAPTCVSRICQVGSAR